MELVIHMGEDREGDGRTLTSILGIWVFSMGDIWYWLKVVPNRWALWYWRLLT